MQERKSAKKKPAKQAPPTVTRKEEGSGDTMLLIGGLALVVLVLCDTVFLTLSTGFSRGALTSHK